MKNKKIIIISGVILIIGVTLFLILSSQQKNSITDSQGQKIKITIFKSPTCSCCEEYVNYLKAQGLQTKVLNIRDTLSIKEKYKIPSKLESCHTATVGDYFIEGHVPIEAIKKLLAEEPEISGIALPGMPSGSPGMSGPKREEFKIQAVSRDGEISEFMSF